MATIIRTRYPSKISDARRTQAEAIRLALSSLAIDGEPAMDEATRALGRSDTASPRGHGHTAAYVKWVLEAAQLATGGMSPREFAKTFLARPFDYSQTRAGIAAVMLEVWLASKGQALFKKFVETVLDGDDVFLAVFDGPLSQAEFDRMQLQTEEFVSDLKPILLHGQRSADNMVSDLTIIELKAAPKLTKDSLPKPAPQLTAPRLEPRDDEKKRELGLRPESIEDYRRVLAEGGISTAALSVVFGHVVVRGDTFVDPNDTTWTLSEDDKWVPVLSEAGGPPSLRKAAKGSWQSCQTCAYYEAPHHGGSGVCSQFDDTPVSTKSLCDAWDGNETGADESEDPTRIRIVLPSSVSTSRSHVFEQSQDGTIRSLSGHWAVFEAANPELQRETVIVLESGSYAVARSLREVTRVVEDLAACYSESMRQEADQCIEHALSEIVAESGKVSVAFEDSDMLPEADKEKPKPKPEDEDSEGSEDAEEEPKSSSKTKKDSDAEPQAPPAPPEPPEPSDRMDEPEFYRDDLQTYYDVQILAGVTPKKAEQKTRQRFDLKTLVVTPTGEVRSPGVTDRPKPPPPPMPAAGAPGAPPAPIEQPDGAPDQAAAGAPPAPKESVDEVASVVAAWAKRTGKSREESERLWQRAGEVTTKNYPDVEPESDQWYQLKMGVFRRMMGIAAESALAEPQTIDDAFHRWVRHADGDVEEFEEWLADNHPHFLPHLAVWMPSDLHESERVKKSPVVLTPENEERYEKWRRLMNMSPRAIRESARRMSEATTSLSVSGIRAFTLGKRSMRRLLALKTKPVQAWNEDDWTWAARQVNTVSKLRATPGPLIAEGKPTEKLVLLRAWGHEPRVKSRVSEREVMVAQRENWRCRSCHALVEESSFRYDDSTSEWTHSCGAKLVVPPVNEEMRRAVNRRVLDVTPGTLPCLVAEETQAVPSFADLKSGKIELTDDERTHVMRKKAVWHHGKNGKASPAVWKSIVDGKTYFVTNTHRAYNVAPTLQGAVGRYHSFIKGTA